MAGYEELAGLAADEYGGETDEEFNECERCGCPTRRDQCRKCSLLEAFA
jgi:recombinational DNA repair protein RecR